MSLLSKAERYTAKSNHYSAEAESAMREHEIFMTNGDLDNARRALNLADKMVSKAQRHARKALDVLQLP